MLSIFADHSGYADIAQLQLLLWTIVIGADAIFAMSLSGTLLDISSTTLVLLGIASITVFLVRTKTDHRQPTISGPSIVPGQAPRWSDLITVGGDFVW
jgi:hypothetical protein